MIGNKFLTMGIESSCDETSVAFLLDGREVLANVISSQIETHKVFGGVVPEIASRHHLDNINRVVEQAFEEAGKKAGEKVDFSKVDLVGVTCGPGLVGALLIGVATAKSYAYAANIPLVGVHHIQGHISAAYIEHPELEPPFVSLVASGGHTGIVYVKDYNEYELIGETRDDAIGEAFDKVARVLGLGYPGGPLVDKLAKEGNPEAVHFKRVLLDKDSYDFSFSGIKTGVLNYVNTEKQAGREINPADIAASFQQAVVDVAVTKATKAVKDMKQDKLVLAGGVAANSKLRADLENACRNEKIKIFVPSMTLCTDNAAMIACSAYYRFKAGYSDGQDLDAFAGIAVDEFMKKEDRR